MSYIKSSLIQNESVVAKATHHWILHFTYFRRLILWSALAGTAAYFHQSIGRFIAELTEYEVPMSAAANGILIISLLFILLRVWKYISSLLWLRSTEYAVTNRRVIMKSGLIRRNTFEVLLTQLETVAVHQGLFGRMLGYGIFSLTGTGGSRGTWRAISNPLQFKKQIEATLHGEGRHSQTGGISPAIGDPKDAGLNPRDATDGPGQFRVVGVNRESGKDAELVIDAQSIANAKVKAELTGLIVTDVKRVGSAASS